MSRAPMHAPLCPRPWPKWERRPTPRQAAAQGHPGVRGLNCGGGYLAGVAECYANGHYGVMLRPLANEAGEPTGAVHMMVIAAGGLPVRDWPELQRIKDELLGRERTAIEVYPPAAEVVNEAHMTHLFVLPPGERLPFSIFPDRLTPAVGDLVEVTR